MKSPRSRRVSRASRIRGSDRPKTSSVVARVAGEERRAVTSTNSREPATRIGAGEVSCHIERPRGVIGSVIICPCPTDR